MKFSTQNEEGKVHVKLYVLFYLFVGLYMKSDKNVPIIIRKIYANAIPSLV